MAFPLFTTRPYVAANILMQGVRDTQGLCYGRDLIGKRQKARNPLASMFKSSFSNFSDGWGYDWQRSNIALVHSHTRSTVAAMSECSGYNLTQTALKSVLGSRYGSMGPDARDRELNALGYRMMAEVHFFTWCFVADGLGKKALGLVGTKFEDSSLRMAQVKIGLSTGKEILGKSGVTSAATSAIGSQIGIQMASQGLSLSTPGLQLLSASREMKKLQNGQVYDLARNVMHDSVQGEAKAFLGSPVILSRSSRDITDAPDRWRVYGVHKDTTMRVCLDSAVVNNPSTSFPEGNIQSVTIARHNPTGGDDKMHGWGNAAVVCLTPIRLDGWGSASKGHVYAANMSRVSVGQTNLQREDLWINQLHEHADRPSGVPLPSPLDSIGGIAHYVWTQKENGSMTAPPTFKRLNDSEAFGPIEWSPWSSWGPL